MRSEGGIAATILAGASLLAAGCSDSVPDSFIVLSLRTTTPAPITNVADIHVKVSNKLTGNMRSLTYAAHGATIDQTMTNTLSVGFTSGETGNIEFEVDALNNLGCIIGSLIAPVSQEIKKGSVAYATVSLTATLNCGNVDGGAPEVPEGGTLPGCDLVDPQSTASGVTTCTSTQTCQVCGFATDPTPRNVCVAGGSGAAGTACVTNVDCMPGTQCFNYASLGCDVRFCLRFCNGNQDCTAVGAGGGGPGSFCQGPVICPNNFLTAYHTCTFNCDPRAMVAGSRGGCPTGLACVMPGAMDQVDCACPEATRTKREGEMCASAAECAPGFICNQMAGSKTCRPICRCDANGAGACLATTNDCPTAGTTCHAVTNNTTYGICLQ